MSHYLVTPEKGRVGHARQIAPFQVYVGTLPTDLGALATAIRKHVWGHCRDRNTRVFVELPPNTSDFTGYILGTGNRLLAELIIEVVEE